MENELAHLDFSKPIVLEELSLWMDGGSATLNLTDKNSTAFSVEFVQSMSLQKTPYTSTPGSFLFNRVEVPIRSATEKRLLEALKNLRLGRGISPKESELDRAVIKEKITFVESEEYLQIARQMDRLPFS